MLQRIQIVTADVDIITIAVLWLAIVLVVRANNGETLLGNKHTGITLAQEVEALVLLNNVDFIANQCTELLQVKITLIIEAAAKVLFQQLHFATIHLHIFVLLYNVS